MVQLRLQFITKTKLSVTTAYRRLVKLDICANELASVFFRVKLKLAEINTDEVCSLLTF